MERLLELFIKHKDLFEYGFCGFINELYENDKITYSEAVNLEIKLNDTIKEQGLISDNLSYYWEPGDYEIRLNWLKQTINKRSLK
jgi:hypothetical protein